MTNGQLALEEFPRANKDERIRIAFNLFQAMEESGVFLINKVPRAGASTAMSAEAINRKETFTAVVPTNHIATETFVETAVKYSDHPDSYVIHIPPNHMCIINEEMCNECPALRSLPVLPIPETCINKKGETCDHYYDCPVTEIQRATDMQGNVLTYHKLVALIIAATDRPNSTAAKTLEKIFKSKNILLDDVHVLQYGQTVTMPVLTTMPGDRRVSFEKYDKYLVNNRYKHIREIIKSVKSLLDDPAIQAKIHERMEELKKEDSWKRVQNITIDNPYKLKRSAGGKFMMAAYNEIIQLTRDIYSEERDKRSVKIRDILNLYRMMSIAMSGKLSIHGTRGKKKQTISIATIDWLFNRSLKKFLVDCHYRRKKVILMSATYGSMDLTTFMHKGARIRSYMFGPGGDPMNTCKQMTIVTDTRGTVGWGLTHTLKRIVPILQEYRNRTVEVYAVSYRMAVYLQRTLHEMGYTNAIVDYYGSKHSIGVASGSRIAVLMGEAYVPRNQYDVICDDVETSRLYRQERMQSLTYQTLNRAKDPQGIEQSVVFAIGITYEEMQGIVTWGEGRNELSESLKVYASESEHAEAEYFRPGLDADYAMLNPSMKSELYLEVANPLENSDKNPENSTHSKPTAWDGLRSRVLARPEVVAAEKGKTMIEMYRKSESQKKVPMHGIPTSASFELKSSVPGLRKPLSGPDANDKHKYISRPINISHIFNKNSIQNETIPNEIYLEADINQPNGIPAVDYKFKMKSLEDFFAGEVRTVSVKVNNRLQILRELCYRWNAYAMQNDDGTYCKQDGELSDELLQDHLDGVITIGAYNLGPENMVRWLCFDVDAHRDKEDTDYDFIARQVTAEKNKNMICNFLFMLGVPHKLEASGSLFSYHVWIFLKPVKAQIAKAFGKAILKELDIKKIEVFPKQDKINQNNGYGNLVKLPFATHRKNGNLSVIWHNGEFVRDFDEMMIGAIDISDYVPDKEEIPASHSMGTTQGVRDIFRWALNQNLSGQEGHWMRIAICREFWCNGLTDLTSIAKLFANQSDYTLEFSYKKVADILASEYNRWKWATLVDRCPDMVAAYMAGRRYEV